MSNIYLKNKKNKMSADTWMQNIATYITNNLTGSNLPDVYVFRRPPIANSISVLPANSQLANVEMPQQDNFFSIEVVIKGQPQTSFNLCGQIRDILLAKQGLLVSGGVNFLKIFALNTHPEVVDITQEESEVYGILYKARLIDEGIPTEPSV